MFQNKINDFAYINNITEIWNNRPRATIKTILVKRFNEMLGSSS